MKNDLFSFRRFGLWALKYYTDNWRMYVTLLGFTALAFLYIYYKVDERSIVDGKVVDGGGLIMLFGMIFLLFVTFKQMRPFQHSRRWVGLRMMPASVPEKYLFAVVNSLLFFVVGFFGVWVLVDLLLQPVLGFSYAAAYDYRDINGPFLESYLLLNSMALFFGTWNFRKNFWTLAAIVIFVIAVVYLLTKVPGWFGMHTTSFQPLSYWTSDVLYRAGNGTEIIQRISLVDGGTIEMLVRVFLGLWTAMFWITGYYTFKEQELK